MVASCQNGGHVSYPIIISHCDLNVGGGGRLRRQASRKLDVFEVPLDSRDSKPHPYQDESRPILTENPHDLLKSCRIICLFTQKERQTEVERTSWP